MKEGRKETGVPPPPPPHPSKKKKKKKKTSEDELQNIEKKTKTNESKTQEICSLNEKASPLELKRQAAAERTFFEIMSNVHDRSSMPIP